jgi:hypothetical protein
MRKTSGIHRTVVMLVGMGIFVQGISLAQPCPSGAPPNADQIGHWGTFMDFGFTAAHAIVLRTGKILWIEKGQLWAIFNPATDTFVNQGAVPIDYNPFCGGHAPLSTGAVLFHGSEDFDFFPKTSIFDPGDDVLPPSWTLLEHDSSVPRFYPTLTTLGDGTVLGTAGLGPPEAAIPTIFNPASGRWCRLPFAEFCGPALNCQASAVFPPSSNFHTTTYPFVFLLTDSRALYAGVQDYAPNITAPPQSQVLNTKTEQWSPLPADVVHGGSAAMYRPNKIMKAGGKDLSGQAIDDVFILDMDAPTPQWQRPASPNQGRLNDARQDHYLVVLPTGQVLAIGGAEIDLGAGEDDAVESVELFDPDTPALGWQLLAQGQCCWTFHSTAVLLPDSRVLMAGGDACVGKAHAFYPPYFFGPGGVCPNPMRPTIDSVDGVIEYGQGFNIETPDGPNVDSVVLMALPAATHGFDQAQRFVPLAFTGPDTLNVQAPANGNWAPPGYYMLFIVAEGVPSVAKIVQLREPPPPPTCPAAAPLAVREGPRYLAITPDPGHDCIVALKITGGCITEQSPRYVDASGNVVESPVYRGCWEWNTVHVRGGHIIPGTQYVITALAQGGATAPPVTVTTPIWGDVYLYDDYVDVSDVLDTLDAFAGCYRTCPAACGGGVCSQFAHDLEPCDPEPAGQVDLGDILAVLDAFAGLPYPHPCPCGSGEGGEGLLGGGMASGTIRLERAQETVAVGGLASVHVFVSDVSDLRGWQFALDSLAANGAVFAWEVLAVDDARNDYVFLGLDDFPAADMTQGRVAAALADGGVSPSAEKYLGTVWFRVTSLGGGSMTVSLDESHTQLRDSAGQSITVVNLGPVTINIIP